jgi:hypothetical protein
MEREKDRETEEVETCRL